MSQVRCKKGPERNPDAKAASATCTFLPQTPAFPSCLCTGDMWSLVPAEPDLEGPRRGLGFPL